MNKNTLKSIGAVVLGALVGILLSTGSDAMMRLMGFFTDGGPPTGDGPFAVATIYRTVYGVLGAYIAARLAPDRPSSLAFLVSSRAQRELLSCGTSFRRSGPNGTPLCSSFLQFRPPGREVHSAWRSRAARRSSCGLWPDEPPDAEPALRGSRDGVAIVDHRIRHQAWVLAVLAFVAFALGSHRTLKRTASSHSDLHHLIDAIGIKNH